MLGLLALSLPYCELRAPADHLHRAACLNTLGLWLGTRFERTGSIDDINRAVDVMEMAVDSTPDDHTNRANWLNNLGFALRMRFEVTGLIEDLSRAVKVAEMAVHFTPKHHPDRSKWLSNHGTCLGRRFERTGSIEDLNSVVDSTPHDHPNRAGQLNNLGAWLGRRFERTGLMDDLTCALDASVRAAKFTPEEHPDRPGCLNSLGSLMGRRFKRTGSMYNLNFAVDITEMAVNSTSQDHPSRATWLANLGTWLGARFDQTNRYEAVDSYVTSRLIRHDEVLQHVFENSSKKGLPMIAVSQLKGNFASLIATSSSTKNLLEIGTLGGYSTIWFAQALQGKGTVTSIEIDPFRRDIAAENLEFGGFRPKDVNVILGAALDVLPQLASEIQQGKREPFDFVFIDCGLGKSVELL